MNEPIFEGVGENHIDVLSLEHVIGNILVSCSENAGLAPVVDSLLGFEGSELHVAAEVDDKLVGMTFHDAALWYPDAVVAGGVFESGPRDTSGNGEVVLCPQPGYRLQKGDRLMMLALDEAGLKPKRQPVQPRPHNLIEAANFQHSIKPRTR